MQNIGGELIYITHVMLDNPRDIEKELHIKFKEHNVFNPKVKNGGTEFFQLSSEQVEEVKCYFNSLQ